MSYLQFYVARLINVALLEINLLVFTKLVESGEWSAMTRQTKTRWQDDLDAFVKAWHYAKLRDVEVDRRGLPIAVGHKNKQKKVHWLY